MIDAIGNVLAIGDIVMVALGARGNRNNSSLTPCRIIDISGSRCLVECANDIYTEHKKIEPFNWITMKKCAWKFSRQVVKIEKYITKV